ncbi:uncharacterized protein PSFLO_03588 [Pseudozyma flocculosa]|uniref:Uncharacterized protein n=1 Tax=Pseudozyma flocculosa TaxID=84751 RepID=A0A5C3F4G2_9BASI|nr:uncharacterized protein PSFLO_03588 [Pseudozyma flocculosa]
MSAEPSEQGVLIVSLPIAVETNGRNSFPFLLTITVALVLLEAASVQAFIARYRMDTPILYCEANRNMPALSPFHVSCQDEGWGQGLNGEPIRWLVCHDMTKAQFCDACKDAGSAKGCRSLYS